MLLFFRPEAAGFVALLEVSTLLAVSVWWGQLRGLWDLAFFAHSLPTSHAAMHPHRLAKPPGDLGL